MPQCTTERQKYGFAAERRDVPASIKHRQRQLPGCGSNHHTPGAGVLPVPQGGGPRRRRLADRLTNNQSANSAREATPRAFREAGHPEHQRQAEYIPQPAHCRSDLPELGQLGLFLNLQAPFREVRESDSVQADQANRGAFPEQRYDGPQSKGDLDLQTYLGDAQRGVLLHRQGVYAHLHQRLQH